MSYNKKVSGIIIAVFFAVFNLIVFLAPFKHDNSFWIGYVFSWIAIVASYFILFVVLKDDSINKMFLGMPFAYSTVVFVIFQFILALIIMAIPDFNTSVSVILEAILLGAFIITILTAQMGRHTIQSNQAYVMQKQFYLKDMLSIVSGYKFYANNPMLTKQLSDLEETIKYSDPMSNERLAPLENKIGAKINELGMILRGGDLNASGAAIQELQGLFAERSRLCRMMK